MKTSKVFSPNNPLGIGLYVILGLIGLWLYIDGSLSLLGLVVCLGFIYMVAAFNSYFFRLEISDRAVKGPSRFGPMVRVEIPWKDADFSLVKDRIGLNYLMIKEKSGQRRIKVAEANFSGDTFQDILELLRRHCGANS